MNEDEVAAVSLRSMAKAVSSGQLSPLSPLDEPGQDFLASLLESNFQRIVKRVSGEILEGADAHLRVVSSSPSFILAWDKGLVDRSVLEVRGHITKCKQSKMHKKVQKIVVKTTGPKKLVLYSRLVVTPSDDSVVVKYVVDAQPRLVAVSADTSVSPGSRRRGQSTPVSMAGSSSSIELVDFSQVKLGGTPEDDVHLWS
jgi:hypothetical protein